MDILRRGKRGSNRGEWEWEGRRMEWGRKAEGKGQRGPVRKQTYQIQLPQPLSRPTKIHDRIVSQIRAIRQYQPPQPRKLEDAPALKPLVGDGSAARQIHRLDARRGVVGNVRHAAVGDVLAIAEGEGFEVGAAYDCAGWDNLLLLLLLLLLARGFGLLGGELLLLLMRVAGPSVEEVLRLRGWRMGRRLADDPTDDAGEQVVAYFAAVAEVDSFERFGSVRHFEDGGAGDVPDALHFPDFDVVAAGGGEFGEAFVGEVEAIADVDHDGTFADEGADDAGDGVIVDEAVVD